MKKLLSCVLVLAFVISMTACNVSFSTGSSSQPDSSSSQSGSDSSLSSSDSESSSTNAGGSKFMTPTEYKDFLKDYINTDHYEELTFDEDAYQISLKDEYNKEPQLFSSREIKVNNDTTVTLGMKYQELIDQGWSFYDDSYNNKEFSAHASGMGPTMKKNGKDLKNTASNSGSSPVKYPDASVKGIDIYYYDGDEKNEAAIDFSLDGKVDNNTDLKSLIDTIGEPRYVYYSVFRSSSDGQIERASATLTYEDSGYKYEFVFLSDGSEMRSFNVNKLDEM